MSTHDTPGILGLPSQAHRWWGDRRLMADHGIVSSKAGVEQDGKSWAGGLWKAGLDAYCRNERVDDGEETEIVVKVGSAPS